MTLGNWVKIGACVLGLIIVAALIWVGGPLIAVADVRPLDPVWVRLLLIAFAASAVTGYFVIDYIRRKKASAEIEAALTKLDTEATGDGDVLKQRMQDAISTLRKTTGANGDYLYDLPWYVLIGPPGSGKTTALINSGLRFPLAGDVSPQAIAGVGGTRYCDWWFTEEAVLIDTAGRYTTQDSDPKGDQKSWGAFLDLLKKNRPKQPLNGVIVCISLEDLMRCTPEELQAHSDAIRKRLVELHDDLKVDFPVYALFTKADLVAGFMEFFGHLNEESRRAVWGVTFQTDDRTKNCISEVSAEFDPLIQRLNQEMVDRLQEEPTPSAKVGMFGFPSQMAMLKEPIITFLARIFEPTRYHANASLRGFYFTSGTQQGTPIDQLIGAIASTFGAQERAAQSYSGKGRSFFLNALVTKVIVGEAGWVSTNRAAVRRNAVLKTVAYASLAAATLGLSAGWWMSYGRNTDQIAASYQAVTQFRSLAGPLRDETVINDNDFARILPSLQHLRNFPAGHGTRAADVPTSARLGLSQYPRLHSAADSSYQNGLERLLRPRMMFRLEDIMRKELTSGGTSIYEPLNVYLMLTGKEALDRELVTGWFRRDFEANLFQGAANAGGRQALDLHIASLLAFVQPDESRLPQPDGHLVSEAQRTLGRMSVADRAFDLLKARARVAPERDWSVARAGGPDVALVFSGSGGENLAALSVPYFFTYQGFHEAFLPRIAEVAQQVQRERKLLGEVGDQASLAAQHENLPQAVLQRYGREFQAVWTQAMARLRVRSLIADRPRYLSLQAAAAATSPIAQLMESIRTETQLTRPRQPAANQTQATAAPATLSRIGEEVPGASIEAGFRTLHAMTEGDSGKRPVDELIKALNDVHQTLIRMNDPAQTAEANVVFRNQLQTLRAVTTRFPQPFATMLQTSANAFDGDATGTAVARIMQGLTDQVTRTCQQMTGGRYPFTRGSNQDMSLAEFQRLFGTNGIIDRFFAANLLPLADTSKRDWTWNATNSVGRQLPAELIRDFQRAQQIRDVFFQGANPSFAFAARHQSMSATITTARLEINSGMLNVVGPPPAAVAAPAPGGLAALFGGSPAPPPAPPVPTAPQPTTGTFQWPGPVGLTKASVLFEPDTPGKVSKLERFGPWAVFRLFEAGTTARNGETMTVRFSLGGRDATYQISPTGPLNPFTLSALREFRCPTGS